MPRIVGKRGLLPYLKGSIQLHFRDYLVRAQLPRLPRSFGHIRNVGNAPTDGMLNNDTAGCCVCAGAEHETRLFAFATKRPMPTFNNVTLANYSNMIVAQGGAPYNPADPSTDTGLDVQAAAQYRRDTGIRDDAGAIHKIDAFASVNDVEELMIATYCFGVCGLGLNLPKTCAEQFETNHVWDDVTSVADPEGGHYPPCVGVNHSTDLVLSTWGELQAATQAYVSRYWSVGVAYLSHEYLTAQGHSPELIDWNGLQEDLAAL